MRKPIKINRTKVDTFFPAEERREKRELWKDDTLKL